MAEPTNFYPLMALVKGLLTPLLKLVSEFLKELLEESIQKLWEKAVTTESPWDDFFVERLAYMLSIKLDGAE